MMELFSKTNGKATSRQRYLYRAPGDIRIEQLGPFHKGVVVVVRPSGKVKARGGGFFSFIKLELNRNAEVLKGITGDSAVDSDWISIIKRTRSMESSLVKYKLKAVRHDSHRGYEVITYLKDQPFDRVRLILRNDGPIVLIERFKDKRLRSRVLWKEIELNPPLTDKDFEL